MDPLLENRHPRNSEVWIKDIHTQNVTKGTFYDIVTQPTNNWLAHAEDGHTHESAQCCHGNTSYNNSFSGSNVEDLYNVPPGVVALLSIFYGTISFISIVGNILVILVVAKNRSMQTVTNFFIANLSLADVMIGIFSIPFQFQAALLQRWDLPWVLCPVAPFVKELTVNVSIFTLTVIAVDRYRAVVNPLKPKCSKELAKLIMAVVWGLGLLWALPAVLVFRVRYVYDGIAQCLPSFPSIGRVDLGPIYRLSLITLQYLLPLAVITLAYFLICYRIWFSRAPGSVVEKRDAMMHKNKIKVIKMLMAVVGLFAFCWMPLQVYNLLNEVKPSINDYRYINIIWICSNWLAMSNSCYNPFIYGFLSEKYKQAFRLLLFKCPCSKPQRNHDVYGDSYDYHLRKSSSSPDAYEHVRVNGTATNMRDIPPSPSTGNNTRHSNQLYVQIKNYDITNATEM